MPVFLSWSGERSRRIAESLRRFLPLVIQRLPVFLSGSDIAAGTKWANVIEDQLAKAAFGIICVTPENLKSPWLNFEAGAVANAVANAVGRPRVAPILFSLYNIDVGPRLKPGDQADIVIDETLAIETTSLDFALPESQERLVRTSVAKVVDTFKNAGHFQWPVRRTR